MALEAEVQALLEEARADALALLGAFLAADPQPFQDLMTELSEDEDRREIRTKNIASFLITVTRQCGCLVEMSGEEAHTLMTKGVLSADLMARALIVDTEELLTELPGAIVYNTIAALTRYAAESCRTLSPEDPAEIARQFLTLDFRPAES